MGIFGEDVVEEGAVWDGGEHGGGGCCNDIAWEVIRGSVDVTERRW